MRLIAGGGFLIGDAGIAEGMVGGDTLAGVGDGGQFVLHIIADGAVLAEALALALLEVGGDPQQAVLGGQSPYTGLLLHGHQGSRDIVTDIQAGAGLLAVDEIGGAAVPALVQLGLTVFAMGNLAVGLAGGVVGAVDILAQLLAEIVAHDGDQMAGHPLGSVFQIGLVVIGLVAVLHRQGHGVTAAQFLADGGKRSLVRDLGVSQSTVEAALDAFIAFVPEGSELLPLFEER